MAEEATRRLSAKDEAFLKTARERFKQAQDADDKQRKREIEDLRFYAGDQWDEDAQKARRGSNAADGMPPIPARPTYVINKLREPIRQVLNQERQSDMGIQLVPADDFEALVGPLDDTEVELREGLARRIQRSSEAADARTWAFSRATIAGRGYYGVMTRFLPGKSWNKEIYVHRWYNQASVSLDPAHEQPDGSDAEWGFAGADKPFDQYVGDHPHIKGKVNEVTKASKDEFRALGEEFPGWFTTEGERRAVRVVDYWYIERTAKTLVLLTDGSSVWKDELAPNTPSFVGVELTPEQRLLVPPGAIIDERDVIQKAVKWCQIDGAQILDEADWEGPDIPIVKVLGEELQPYDDERRAEGIVRPARNSQEGFNAMVSKGVEEVGLSPIPPWQATPEQIEGFEAWYQASNTRALPYLPYNRVTDGGEPLGPPTRTPSGTDLTKIFASIQMFDEALQSTTGVPEARVGRNTDARLKSGRALRELRESSEQGTSNYMDNLRRSIRYEGQIINNLLYPIYGKTPGRIVRIMTGEGDAETVRIAPPPGAQAPMGAPGLPGPGMPPQPGLGPAKPPKEYRLTPDANFNVIVKVARASDSRRVEESDVLGELFGAMPQLLGWFGDIFFKNKDWPGSKDMAERAKVMLAPPIQQMLAQKEQGANIPPEVQQQMAQMSGKLKEAEGIMQQMHQELQTKQAENETKLKVAKISADKDVELQKMRNAATIEVAMINARAKGVLSAHEAQDEAIALGQELTHDHVQGELDRQHERELALQGQQHEAGLAAADTGEQADEADAQRQHEAELGEQAHQQAMEQGNLGHQQELEVQQQAAALTPPDESGA